MNGSDDVRAEVEELRRVIEGLRARLLALSRVLPVEYLSVLEEEPGPPEAATPNWDLFAGWRETTDVVNSDVATELRLLWERLAPRGSS